VNKAATLAIGTTGALAVGLIAWVALRDEAPATASNANIAISASAPVMATSAVPQPDAPAANGKLAQNMAMDVTLLDDDSSEDPKKMFQADAAGNLVLKERTRHNLEKMLWIYSPDEQRERLAVIERTLPASAYRQLTEMMDRYQTMTLAAKQSYPPDTAPATVADAIAQHEGISALRRAHLGAEVAEAMFGREERLNRQLLEFMDLEKHEGLTMDEKAIKAQEMLLKSPELSAAYEQNRAESERPSN
jgi:hypothetical protein